jgi:hypothetical protein
VYDDPHKTPFKMPQNLKEQYPSLASLKTKVRTRIFTKTNVQAFQPQTSSDPGAALFNPKKPLQNWKLVMVGKFDDKKAVKKDVIDLGAEITSKTDTTVPLMVSTEGEAL